MKDLSMVEQWRSKFTYETDERCKECGSALIDWKREGMGERFCERCKSKELTDQKEEQQRIWTNEAYQAKAIHKMKGSSLVKDKEVWSYKLDNYKAIDQETSQALNIAQQAAESISASETIHVVFSGVAGAGKTTLSMGILREVLSKDVNKHCMFLDYQYLLEELKAGFNDKFLNQEMDKVMKDAYRADVLVIDDLGAETSRIESRAQTATDFTVKTLNSILQARVSKTTIVTTNLTGSQIKQAYGARITSRLFAHSQGYAMAFKETADKRLNPI